MNGPYPPEVKAAALAHLATGASVSSTARHFGVSRAALIAWRTATGALHPTPVQQQKRIDLGEQLYEYLQESIVTLVAQLQFARNPDWLARQNAADLAVFMGVAADKATRLLAAFRPADNPPDAAPLITIPDPAD